MAFSAAPVRVTASVRAPQIGHVDQVAALAAELVLVQLRLRQVAALASGHVGAGRQALGRRQVLGDDLPLLSGSR
jgi:hypothetical protein